MPNAAPMMTSPAPIAFKSENGAAAALALAASGLCVRRAAGQEKQAAGQNGELDQLHLTVDSLHFWRHTSGWSGMTITRRPRRNHGGFDQEFTSKSRTHRRPGQSPTPARIQSRS